MAEDGWVVKNAVHKNGLSGKMLGTFKMKKKDLKKVMFYFNKYEIPY